MESGNEQSQGDMTKDTEDSTQLANSQNTEECEGTDMTIDDSGFTPVRSKRKLKVGSGGSQSRKKGLTEKERQITTGKDTETEPSSDPETNVDTDSDEDQEIVNKKTGTYRDREIKQFLQKTKNMKGVKVEQYFPNKLNFVESTTTVIKKKSKNFTDQEIYRLKKKWWDHGKVLIQQLCCKYTVNITRDITKSLKDLEIGIVELQALAESTGDRRHVEDLKVKKVLMADLLGTKAQGALIRSRFKGANEMDAPSKYFFRLEKKNGQSRLIHTLRTGNGQYITHTDEIRRYATDFCQDLYRSEHRDNKELLDTFYQGLPKVSSEDNAALEGLLVLEELR
ncbi:hypothetical protein QTP70_031757 [Hemibagrus guttatus]|uniref:Uncharacterized protein n=1 Tax=Hemibagrus guttatus TaxID=175788 RepID=A0AAE0V2P2_9TELE|nr:hypothetical protein QTP70_031757 [Hemibagrus guttatus]